MIRYLLSKVKHINSNANILFSVMEDYSIDQAGCFENTLALLQRGKYFYFAKTSGLKSRLKAEQARFLSGVERRAKPETEHLLPRWGKRCVFLNPLAGASFHTVFSPLNLIPCGSS